MVTIIYADEFLKHGGDPDHPEKPGRLTAIVDALKNVSFSPHLTWQKPTPPHQRSLLALLQDLHDLNYIQALQDLAQNHLVSEDQNPSPYLDVHTYLDPDSYEVALLAVSAWLDGVDQVLASQKPAFVLSRPPGHHALRDRGMGFCLLNNAAIAAHYALRQPSIDRVAILDWDVHHGNGTQSLVENNPNIAFCSLHEMPAYPGTGYPSETGLYNNVLNIPIAAGSKIIRYQEAFEFQVMPFLAHFKPNILIVSAGYDANATDPLSRVCLLPQDYGIFTKYCLQLTPRILFGLEGGYALKELGESVVETIAPLIANSSHE